MAIDKKSKAKRTAQLLKHEAHCDGEYSPCIDRRSLLGAGLFSASMGFSCPGFATGASRTRVGHIGVGHIRVGQTLALTGPLSAIGQALYLGARLGFERVNSQGGVHGKHLELIAIDDGYVVNRSVENVRAFLADPDIFSIFSPLGTPNTAAILPLIQNSDITCFAPLTGGLAARPAEMRNVMNIRASYAEEAGKIVQHFTTVGIRRISIAYQDNTFGLEVRTAAEAIARATGIELRSVIPVATDGSDIAAATSQVASGAPEAVLVGLAGTVAVEFIKRMRRKSPGASLYALSTLASAIDALGKEGRGLTFAQVMPQPSRSSLPITRSFMDAWRSAGVARTPSTVELEGWINAHVFCEALRRSGPDLTRKGFIDAVWSMKSYDLGGFRISFERPGKNASTFVELVMISQNGKLIA